MEHRGVRVLRRAACPPASSRRASATCPRSSSGTPTRCAPSLVATVIWIGCSTPCARPTCSISPTARSTAPGGSSSRPSVSARKKNTSESVEPSIAGYSVGSTASTRSRFTSWKSRDQPVVHPQPAAVAERMAVRLLHRRSGRGADVREHEPGLEVCGEVSQVPVVPGGLDAVERARASRRRRTSRSRIRRRSSSPRPSSSGGSGR